MGNFAKLQRLLEELFQLDQADLDFGIYRIMNQKRDEIVRFLEKDLLPQVKEAFSHYRSADKAVLQKELDKLIQQIEAAGMNPDDSPKVQELKAQIADSSVDVTALENEVFSHLYNFFRRYYHEGDFISQRRYKEGVYAIPYEGEEVKLYWANHDQYYVKSSEYLRDFSFQCSVFSVQRGEGAKGGQSEKVKEQRRVSFKVVSGSTEQDNRKEQAGKERRFVLCDDDPVIEENGELIIRFEYRPQNGQKQDALNAQTIERLDSLLKTEHWKLNTDWHAALFEEVPLGKATEGKTQPRIAKHLRAYTARNTFDYFIHKDLGGFLRRELDFYIKNEVMHLDDIEHDTVPRVEQYLSKIKVIRKIAHKVIQFLEQLENFQKKLWLKKKFVVETNYCITLDRVPEELYPEIAANDAQREEWVRLFAIDEIKKDLNQPGYSKPLTVEFLKAQPFLLLDTKFFDSKFFNNIVKSIDSIDDSLDGVLVHADNFQALQFMSARLSDRIDCIYIDPPYNTDAGPISYKNGYRSSSWVSMMYDRLVEGRHLLADTGTMCVTIDDYQQKELHYLLDAVFSADNVAGTVVIRINPSGRPVPAGFGQSHEYAIFAKKTSAALLGRLPRSEQQSARYKHEDDDGNYMWELFRKRGSNSERTARPSLYYPIYVKGSAVRVPKMEYNEAKREWVALEAPLSDETVVFPIDKSGTERTWRGTPEGVRTRTGHYMAKGEEGEITIYYKFRPASDDVLPLTNWIDSKYSATEHGTGVLKHYFKEYNPFSYPKSLYAVEDCLRVGGLTASDSCVVDFFAGSGTTGHATITLNRQDEGTRKYFLVEVGSYFDTVTKPRVCKAAYSSQWKDGSPVGRDGISHTIKYIRLESYEDTLGNLELKRTSQQASLLDQDDDLREQYILSYMLDVESRGSQSLLNVESFRNPDQYKLRVERNGETQLVNVDLVETFNWLLGLTVKHIDVIRGVRVVEGTNPAGERVLVLWRNLDETDNNALDEWFKKQDYNTKDQEYDLIYVNGDNNLENLRRGDQTWKVRLIEEEFGRLMFDVQDV